MDKYEFNLKIEQIKKMITKKDYATAMKIADTIDWRRVRNVKLLSLVSQIYEYNQEYHEAKEILLLAYERAPVGKRILYKLVELAIKEENSKEAELYFDEFKELAPSDPRQYLLKYMLLSAKNAEPHQLIPLLESYKSYDFDEKWSYELAQMYDKAGREKDCVNLCDSIALWFGVGKYVLKAMELKKTYEPLTKEQQELLDHQDVMEEKLKAVEEEFKEVEIKKEIKTRPRETEYANWPAKTKVKKEQLLEEAEADPEAMNIEEILEQDQDKLAQEVIRLTKEQESEEVQQISEEVKIDVEQKEIVMEENSESEIDILTPKVEEEGEDTFALQEESESEIPESAVCEGSKTPRELVEERLAEMVEEEIDSLEKVDVGKESDNFEEQQEDVAEPEGSYYHILVRSNGEEEGIKLAVGALKRMHSETGTSTNKIAKISAEKLNARGILNSMDKLSEKNLVIEHAGELNDMILKELHQALCANTLSMAVVLIDSPQNIRIFQDQYPSLAEKFACIVGDSEQLEVKDFVNYAKNYALELDCIVDDMGLLALYAVVEERVGDNLTMTEADAEMVIENAAEYAAKKTIKKMLTGVFSSRYDKDGLLILKENHFR